MKFPNKKYDVIVIDPPWKIKKVTHKTRPNQVKMDYPLMELDKIKQMPIKKFGKRQMLGFSLDNTKILIWCEKCFGKLGF